MLKSVWGRAGGHCDCRLYKCFLKFGSMRLLSHAIQLISPLHACRPCHAPVHAHGPSSQKKCAEGLHNGYPNKQDREPQCVLSTQWWVGISFKAVIIATFTDPGCPLAGLLADLRLPTLLLTLLDPLTLPAALSIFSATPAVTGRGWLPDRHRDSA